MSRIIVLFMFCIGIITIKNREKADNIKNGKPEYEVVFEYNSNPIKTSSNLVFVGLTEKHLFLRDLNQKKNKIYSLGKIDLLELSKNEIKDINHE